MAPPCLRGLLRFLTGFVYPLALVFDLPGGAWIQATMPVQREELLHHTTHDSPVNCGHGAADSVDGIQ